MTRCRTTKCPGARGEIVHPLLPGLDTLDLAETQLNESLDVSWERSGRRLHSRHAWCSLSRSP